MPLLGANGAKGINTTMQLHRALQAPALIGMNPLSVEIIHLAAIP